MLLTASAQLLVKKSGEFPATELSYFKYLVLGAGVYFVAFIVYSRVLSYFPISRISPISTISAVLLVALGGRFIFLETLSVWNYVGIGLGIVAVFFIAGDF